MWRPKITHSPRRKHRTIIFTVSGIEKQTVDTGDHNNVLFYLWLSMLSSIVMIVMVLKKKKCIR